MLRTRPIRLTTFWVNIRGLFNPTLIDWINKLMTNNNNIITIIVIPFLGNLVFFYPYIQQGVTNLF